MLACLWPRQIPVRRLHSRRSALDNNLSWFAARVGTVILASLSMSGNDYSKIGGFDLDQFPCEAEWYAVLSSNHR